MNLGTVYGTLGEKESYFSSCSAVLPIRIMLIWIQDMKKFVSYPDPGRTLIRIQAKTIRIRILDNDTDPADPDPQHCCWIILAVTAFFGGSASFFRIRTRLLFTLLVQHFVISFWCHVVQVPFRGPVYDFIFIAFKYLNVTSIRIKLIEEKEKKFITEKFLKQQDSDPHQSDPNLQR